jgi:predicted transcriptional regulator
MIVIERIIMNNKEIERILDETSKESFCDGIIKILSYEKEYKQSDFYKTTKIPLLQLYKNYKESIAFSPKEIFNYIQENIDKLNLENLDNVLNQFVHETDSEYNDTIQKAKDAGFADKLKEAGVIK